MWAQYNVLRLSNSLLLCLWADRSLFGIYRKWLPLCKLLGSCDVTIDDLWLLDCENVQFDLVLARQTLWGVHFFVWRVGELYITCLPAHIVKSIGTTLLRCGNDCSVLIGWRSLLRCLHILRAHLILDRTCEDARVSSVHTTIERIEEISLELFLISQPQVRDWAVPGRDQCRGAAFYCVVCRRHIGVTIVRLNFNRRWLADPFWEA